MAVAQSTASEVLSSAIGVWHMADAQDSTQRSVSFITVGECQLNQSLSDLERQVSQDRGGDGIVANLGGGCLLLGEYSNGILRNSPKLAIHGDHFSWLIRFRCLNERLWSTRGIFTQGGGHDALSFNLFSYDFGNGREAMQLGFEIGVLEEKGLAGQVKASLAQIGVTQWHDVITRYDGARLDLFVDGVLLDSQTASGLLRSENTEPIAIGASTTDGKPDNAFIGLVDHVGIWDRTLTDEEVIQLSGGQRTVQSNRERFAKYQAPALSTPVHELVDHSRILKSRFQRDPHRPRYHFLHCEEGDAMPGDPNGAIWWKGRYHLFYIFQRRQTDEPKVVHCWGHASSTDLCHWEHHPTGLDVSTNDPDRGIFSGNALLSREGIPTIVYHGVGVGNCMAQSTDDELIHWTKSPHNPIVPLTQPNDLGWGKYDSWDPHCWLEGNSYYAIFGGNPSTGSPASLFKGPEIEQLQYVGPFLTDDHWSQKDEDISCPDFFPLGRKHVLSCISHMRGARCFIGQWKDGAFTPEKHIRMNWPGGAFFAPESLVDDRNRRIVWAWCMDERPEAERLSSGWSGTMSLPRVISLDSNDELIIQPPQELERLRYLPRELNNLRIESRTSVNGSIGDLKVTGVQGDCLELEVEFHTTDSDYFGLRVRSSPSREEETTIAYDRKSKRLKIDVSKSSLDPSIRYRTWCLFKPTDPDDASRLVTAQEAPFELKDDEPLKLRVFLDHSMLEVFANERQCVTQRIWPTLPDANEVRLFSESGTVEVPRLRAWNMAATTPD